NRNQRTRKQDEDCKQQPVREFREVVATAMAFLLNFEYRWIEKRGRVLRRVRTVVLRLAAKIPTNVLAAAPSERRNITTFAPPWLVGKRLCEELCSLASPNLNP